MAEANAGSPEEAVTGSAETPSGLTAEQVSEIVAAAMDQRVSGLMSSFDKRFDNIQKDVSRASMTQQEIDDAEEAEASAELERLRRENAILSAGADMPAAVKAFQELNAKASGKEQLEFLQSLIDAGMAPAKAPEAPSDEPADEEADAPVDPNRNAATTPQMDVEAAGSILDQFKEWPGADFFRR